MAADPNDLTTIARVKERLTITDSNRDAMLQSITTELSLLVQRLAGRLFNEQTHTHYLDGTGLGMLWLPDGPLVSVTSVNSVAYADSGAGARGETLTAVDPYLYLEIHPRSELDGADAASSVRDGPSALYMRSGVWTRGVRNYKVVYVAGYDTLPQALVHGVTNLVAGKYHQREADGLRGRDIEGGSLELVSPAQWDEAVDRVVAPWRYRWGIA